MPASNCESQLQSIPEQIEHKIIINVYHTASEREYYQATGRGLKREGSDLMKWIGKKKKMERDVWSPGV